VALFALGCALAWGASASELASETRHGDLVSVFGGPIHVPPGVLQDGDVVSIGGRVTIEGGVTGDVVVVLGGLELAGRVGGDVAGVLTDQELRGARIDGSYASVLGTLDMQGSHVGGELVNVLSGLSRDDLSSLPAVDLGAYVPGLLAWLELARLLLIFLFLLFVVALAPERVRVIGEAAPVRYVAAFFTGLLGYLLFVALLVPVAATLVGIPIYLMTAWMLKWLAIAGVFQACGSRLARSWGGELSQLGAVLGTFALCAVATLVPLLFGWWGVLAWALVKLGFFLAVEVPAVGLLILTRIGTSEGSIAPRPGSGSGGG
jgi:hypothetical protein